MEKILNLTNNFSPLDQFAIRNLLSIEAPILGDASFSLTNIGFYLVISTFIIVILYLVSNNYNKVVSNNWSASQESVYATVHSIVINQINDKKGQMYFPFIFTLFIFILANNLIGMVKKCLYLNIYIYKIFNYFIVQFYNVFSCFVLNNLKPARIWVSKLYYSNKCNNNNYVEKLHPYYITGFTDGEGCFSISIFKDSRMSTGWQVKPIYKISLHNRDKTLLILIQKSLGVGKIYKHGENSLDFRVSGLKNLKVVINHFDKYPLITKKSSDYLLFKQAVKLIAEKEHLTKEGLLKLVNLKASLNTGLSDKFKLSFPYAIPVTKPLVKNETIMDINWFIGFVEAEGSFQVIHQQLKSKSESVSLRFTITQHFRDKQLIESLVNYLSCGRYYKSSNRNEVYFISSTFEDNYKKIIPIFAKYPLYGSKQKDYLDYVKVANLIKSKDHLTAEGLSKIKLIQNRMNSKRNNII